MEETFNLLFILQVIEDNGVRRVVVVPQAPEFHPGGHTVIHRSPHPPLPGFIPVPTMMPPPPRHMYSPVTGAGDMATQYMAPYQSSQVYGDVGKTSRKHSCFMELAGLCLESLVVTPGTGGTIQ